MKTPSSLSNLPRQLLACCALLALGASARAQSLLITTLAGGSYGSVDGTGTGAGFNYPTGVALDAAGNLYVADTDNQTIRKITPAGVVTTLAGSPGVQGSADGSGSGANFNRPDGVAVDAAGNVYVADTNNHTIRKITPAGVVTTLAGTAGAHGSADGTGSSARFNSPVGLSIDGAGNLYVGDLNNETIRKVTPAGAVSTLAGSPGVSGSSDGAGANASFNSPQGTAVDALGNVYVADSQNHTIRKITPAGVVTTIAGAAGIYGSADGTGASARFYSPGCVAVDPAGDIFVGDSLNSTIRGITANGVVTTLAGTAHSYGYSEGSGAAARFSYVEGIAADASGNVYIGDSNNERIRKGVASGAPTIGTAPLTQSAGVGNAVTFSVAASSATAVTYQWSFNGTPISGATSSTYTTRPIQLSDQGLYSVAVANSVGTTLGAASLTATFTHEGTYPFNSWNSSYPLPSGTSQVAVAYDGINFLTVALDGTAYFSADGLSWTASASNGPPGQTWGELNSVVNIPGKNMLVAVGNGGAVVTFASGTYNGTLQASGSTSLLTGVGVGNGTLVAVGYGGACITSDLTASIWKSATTGALQNLNAIAYGNGRFVAVGLGGTVVSSPDGSTWTVQNLGSTDDLYGIAYGARGFVAVGSNGGIFSSPDGALWLQQASPTSTVLVHVGYGDGVFVAVGFAGTVLTSLDEGVTWTSESTGTSARLDGVTLGKDAFLLTGTGGVVVQSAAANPSRIINLSARSTVGTGGNILIAGFVINGTGSKEILLRGVGPTLAQFGVSQPLSQPNLALISSGGTTLATNSTWGGGATLTEAFAQVGAFALPSGSADAALLRATSAGAYTSQLSGLSGTTGVGLAEIYDADTGTPTARLINISARASVGTGSNILIAGFVISGNTPEKVVVRGIGPTLSQFGVTGSLATPQLVLYDSGNNALQVNNTWGGGPALTQAFAQVGAFALPSGSADAAILVTLPPGAYTAELSGVSAATGVGLAEVYEVP
jgi:NHL repeat